MRSNAQSNHQGTSLQVKICGVTNVADAELAVQNGADLIGMIMWPKAKRSVDDSTAAAISACAEAAGAKTVGVFVDETAETICARSTAAGLSYVQLHGDDARKALPDLPADTQVIFVLGATPDGIIQTPLPSKICSASSRLPEYVLVDSMKGGSGVALDWKALQVPEEEATCGWLLAGGLTADNVAAAVSTARPTGVDVSSGVCGPDGLTKDADKVVAFIASAKEAGSSL